jgi:hypothetical protein
MLKEILSTRQIPGEARRRWFTSDSMDLVIWFDAADTPMELQLCYDKGHAERALTWKDAAGYTHTAVDDGEAGDGRYKATPILVADGGFDAQRVGSVFLHHGTQLPADIVEFVMEKIRAYLPQISDFSYRTNSQQAIGPGDGRRHIPG